MILDSKNGMGLTTLKYRIEQGEEYLLALEEFQSWKWSEFLAVYRERKLALPQAMVLVHPTFYEDRETNAGESIRGPRSFSTTAGQYAAACMADQIWLSACPLESPEDVHSDHLFPYSLGGPTLAQNQLFLCPVHNRSKANDIHLFPWERGEPSWLATQVERIRSLLL